MSTAPLLAAPLAALLALGCLRAEINTHHNHAAVGIPDYKNDTRLIQNGLGADGGLGCRYSGRWYAAGAAVAAAPCVRCVCVRGALSCARRVCTPPPPPPPRCHLLQRRDACCPELHCPDGVTLLEHAASARVDHDAEVTDANVFPVCVEDGTVYAAGSALSARAACEQCFCLGGTRRCVRPACLRAPAGCRAAPAAGACCPARYHCTHAAPRHCRVQGAHVPEGDRAPAAESAPCERCFCLQGAVHCQPVACAPPLHGCTPLLRAGDCCPHQYRCHNHTLESTGVVQATAKVKRRTGEPPPPPLVTTTSLATEPPPSTTELPEIPAETPAETTAGLQLLVNGTVNCTAELSAPDAALLTAGGGDSYAVNVSSSLRANASLAAPGAAHTNDTKEDYDYEYAEPTLPPSLPNLKIIPFVAADAVLEGSSQPPAPALAPLLERADTQPVYMADPAPLERADMQPVYMADPVPLASTPDPSTDGPFTTQSAHPPINLFSPPVQTEGGFVPKGPGILGEYYAVGPGSTSAAPLLSTSMPLASAACTTPGGEQVPAGGQVHVQQCTRCTCLWGRLHCTTSAPCAQDSALPETTTADVSPPRDVPTSPAPSLPPSTVATTNTTTTTTTPPTTVSPDEQEDDDEGFSFGSVLKLLLSEAYDPPPPSTTTRRPTTTPAAPPFVPLPYQPPYKSYTPNTLNRIDHLVLGETTAIKQPATKHTNATKQPITTRQTTTTKQPAATKQSATTRQPAITNQLTTRQPAIIKEPSTAKQSSTTKQASTTKPPSTFKQRLTTKEPYITKQSSTSQQTSTNGPLLPVEGGGGGGAGLPVLAGCNIYGRMYRVGRIIPELSGPCQQCECATSGVSCRALPCDRTMST